MDEALLQNFALALVAIVNPLGKIPVWLKAARGCDTSVQLRLAALVTLTALILLLLFLAFGRHILGFLGLDLPAVQVGGGIVILLTGIEMLKGREIDLAREDPPGGEDAYDRAKTRFRDVVVPFSVPILAGPGSIITVTLFGSRVEDWAARGLLAALLTGVMILVLAVLLAGPRIESIVGELALNVQSRVWGLLLTAIAAQMIIVGLGDSFPAWVSPRSPIVDDLEKQESSADPEAAWHEADSPARALSVAWSPRADPIPIARDRAGSAAVHDRERGHYPLALRSQPV